MRLFVLVACVPSAASVLNGNYVAASEMDTHPFRGAVQSGGGSGMVITVEGGEAVVFTAAHGYDLKYTEPHSASWMELMDFKKDEDGGLRTAFGSVTATGGGASFAASDGVDRGWPQKGASMYLQRSLFFSRSHVSEKACALRDLEER